MKTVKKFKLFRPAAKNKKERDQTQSKTKNTIMLGWTGCCKAEI